MPTCFVPYCSSGYHTQIKYLKENNLPLPRFFSPGTEERRKEWEQSIKRGDKAMKMTDRVCSDHFLPEDVEVEFRHIIQGKIHNLSRERAKLKPTAIPQIFPNYPVHLQPKIRKRKPPLARCSLNSTTRIKVEQGTNLEDESFQNVCTINTCQQPKLEITECQSEQEFHQTLAAVEQKWSPTDVIKLQLPVGWVICNTVKNDKKVLVHINDQIVIDKSICFEHKCPPCVVFRGHIAIDENFPKNLESVDEAQQVLNKVHNLKICEGTGLPKIPYSVSCIGAVGQRGKRCSFCMAEKKKVCKQEWKN